MRFRKPKTVSIMKMKLTLLVFSAVLPFFGYSQFTETTPSSIKLKNSGIVTSSFDANSNQTNIRGSSLTGLPIKILINGFIKAAFTQHPTDNSQGDLGIGNSITINTSNILSRVHSYGVGENAVTYGDFVPFKSAILGQAYGTIPANTNKVGVLGMTDGQDGSFNIGVAGIGSNTNNFSFSTVCGLLGYTDVYTGLNSYGGYNYSINVGSGSTIGTYSYASKPTSSRLITGKTYGSLNQSINYGDDIAYGAYNFSRAENNHSYGSYNTASNYSPSSLSFVYGSYNEANSYKNATAYGMYGRGQNAVQPSGNTWGDTFGGYGEGFNNASSYTSYGLYGKAGGLSTGSKFGVYGSADSNTGTKYGVYGIAIGTGTNYAGYFAGNVNITGTLSKGSGTFKIDHPLDPENKYLYHSFVESPDMMNIYNGNITTDANGDARVTLPAYFDALNKDFRYQLTTIGKRSDAWIAEEIVGNTFKISTEQPNTKVSWQVTGVRQDAFANANRVIPEVDKKNEEKGKYLHPEAFGKVESVGIDFTNKKEPSSPKILKDQNQPEVPKPQLSTPWPVQMPIPAKEGTTDSGEAKKQ